MKKIKSRLIEKDEFKRIIKRLSFELIEKYKDCSNIALVGITTRGEGSGFTPQISLHIDNINMLETEANKSKLTMANIKCFSVKHQLGIQPLKISCYTHAFKNHRD